jgi:hypothetical protein
MSCILVIRREHTRFISTFISRPVSL